MFARMVRTPVGLKKLRFASQFRSLRSSTYCAPLELILKSNPCMSESCDWLSNDSIYISVRKMCTRRYSTDAVDLAFGFGFAPFPCPFAFPYGTMGAAVDEALVEAGPYELLAGGPFGAGAAVGTGKGADVFALVAGVGFLAGGGPGLLPTPPCSWSGPIVRQPPFHPPVNFRPLCRLAYMHVTHRSTHPLHLYSIN